MAISKIEKYTEDNGEIGILSNSLKKMTLNLEKYIEHMKKATAEKEKKINTELNIAKKIQASMLPTNFSKFQNNPKIIINAIPEPAKEVGGDFYDFFLINNNHLTVVIGDVSGKGILAAIFMAIAKNLIKNNAQEGNEP